MTIGFRAAATGRIGGGVTGSPVTITIPASVQAGDLLLLSYIADSGPTDPGGQGVINDPTGVTGWTALDAQQNGSSSIAKSFWKTAAAADAGASVTVNYGVSTGSQHASLTLVAWSGEDTGTPLAVVSAAAVDSTSSTTHVMPTIDTTGHDQCLIASLYMGREPTASSSYSVTAGWNIRASNLGTAGATGGNPECCVIDGGTQVAAGTGQGGATITGDQAGTQNYAWTFAIAPSVAVQTARPTVDVTTTGWTPSTSLGSGVAECTLVADSNDSTYVTSSAAPSSQVWEAKLPVMSAAPETVTNRVYFTGGAVSGTVVTSLVQGTTVIASRTDSYSSTTPPPTTPTDLVLTLTSAEQSSITNLSDLRIRCTVTAA